MNTTKKLMTLLLVMLALTGCKDDKDEPLPGEWPPMEWVNVDHLAKDGKVYLLNENGGTFSFECTNYKGFRLSQIDDDYLLIIDEERKSFKGEWFEIMIQGNKLFFIADPLPSSALPRTVSFWVSAGDTWTNFTFRQQKMS